MLEVKNTEIFGLNRAIKASKNPMSIGDINTRTYSSEDIEEKDKERANKLGSAQQGSGHDNFLSGIIVYFDVKYPLYWSPEFQRYHFNQIISSQSTMHRLTYMPNKGVFEGMFNQYVDKNTIKLVEDLIRRHNDLDLWKVNGEYINPETGTVFSKEEWDNFKYIAFMKVRSNLPSGFEMWMTVQSNYLQLKTMYSQRKNHKLKEDWGAFCDWIKELPKFKELTGVV